MQSIELSGLFVQPIVKRVQRFIDAGKLDEDDLERALSTEARDLIDHSIAAGDWTPLGAVEGFVSLVAEQLGGETGLVELADEIVADWLLDPSFGDLMAQARGLVDGPGFVVSQASERLVRAKGWQYDGGREGFSVRLLGISDASAAFMALLGATLARLAAGADARTFDVRFEGIDADELVVFGELETGDIALAESRLHRAALIP
jgi:hypothetical protein